MKKKFIYNIFLAVSLILSGCSTISYNRAKSGLRYPDRYKFTVSNPAWSSDGQAIYFIVLGIPCKYEVVQEDGFSSLQRFPFIYTGYYGTCNSDLSRKAIYKFIKLIPEGQGNFTVLMDWQLRDHFIPTDLNSLNVLDKDRFVLRQILSSLKMQKSFPSPVRETIIDINKLQTESVGKIVGEDPILDCEAACKPFARKYGAYPLDWEGTCKPFVRTNIVYSPDGEKFIKILDDFIVIFDASGKKIAQLANDEIGALPQGAMFSPDGSKLALSDSANNIYIFDIEKNKLFQYRLDKLIATFGYRY